jgi:hypothetical protein
VSWFGKQTSIISQILHEIMALTSKFKLSRLILLDTCLQHLFSNFFSLIPLKLRFESSVICAICSSKMWPHSSGILCTDALEVGKKAILFSQEESLTLQRCKLKRVQLQVEQEYTHFLDSLVKSCQSLRPFGQEARHAEDNGNGVGQPAVVGAIPGQAVWGSIKRQALSHVEQTRMQHFSTVSASALDSRFLPCLSVCPDFLQ